MVLWIRERDSLVMARLVSWLNLAAICYTLYSARSDFRPLTSSRVCFEIMLGITCWHVDLNNAAVQWGVDRGNTTQAVFSDIINLAGVDYREGSWNSVTCTVRLSAVEAKIIFIGPPPPVPPVPCWSQSGGTLSPHTPGCTAHAQSTLINIDEVNDQRDVLTDVSYYIYRSCLMIASIRRSVAIRYDYTGLHKKHDSKHLSVTDRANL